METRKDSTPEYTIGRIKTILKELGINVIEKEILSYENYWYSVRVEIEKLDGVGVNGKGISKKYALASAYGELMERLQSGTLIDNLYSSFQDADNYEYYNTQEEILNNNSGIVICLVKPLFEVDSAKIRKIGNINNESLLKEILIDLYLCFKARGYHVKGVICSPVTGNKGTIEFFMCLDLTIFGGNNDKEIYNQIRVAVERGSDLRTFNKNYECENYMK